MVEKQTAIVGGGCFWCIESAFNMLQGVYSAKSGYAGGDVIAPTYQQICQGDTGHAEVVKIEFDPNELTYEDLLNVFFNLHDPTQLNRQGNDVGPQYRSIIMYQDEEQHKIAQQVINNLTAQNKWSEPIVTQLMAASDFYLAEDYHQGYALTNPNQPYCAYVVLPKLHKFRNQYKDNLKT